MASLDIATKANPALVLPALLISAYLERKALLRTVTKTYHERETLDGKDSIRLTTDDGETLSNRAVAEYFGELSSCASSPRRASSILEWVQRSEGFTTADFSLLNKHLDELNDHLTLRSHIVGHTLSVADVAVWAAMRGNRVVQAVVKKSSNNMARWYHYIEASNPWFSDAVAEFTIYTTKERMLASSIGASYDIDLPNMDGPMVTRFPPEPSGALHIGHAKAALLNDYFAKVHAGGKLICRFDDTNPSKESMVFEQSIIQDLKLIEITPNKTTHSSDYFQVMYEYAIQLIKDGKAFADDSLLGKGDESRKNRLPSKRRDLSTEESLARFSEMKSGSKEGQRWCLRARIAYDSPNGTLRDPVIYRCNLTPHHRTGTQWKMYPTYDFCAPILDSIEGITVALRTNEYRDRNAQYEWMQDALGLRRVAIWDFSRMNFIRTVLSKRKLTKIVEAGVVWGWDDPRMPTIGGILRRGLTVPALREFVLKQGPSRNVLNLEWGALWALNRKLFDSEAPRYTAVAQDQAVRCHVHGICGPETATKPRHMKNPELGEKKVLYDKVILLEQADAQTFEEGEEITLMNWGNAFVRNIVRDQTGSGITAIDLELHLEGDFKKTKKVTWLAATSTNLIPVDLVTFDYLITKDKLEKNDKLENFLTPVTETRSEAFADCNVTELPQGTIIQFERKGYYKLDVPYNGPGSRMIFFDVPSGKT